MKTYTPAERGAPMALTGFSHATVLVTASYRSDGNLEDATAETTVASLIAAVRPAGSVSASAATLTSTTSR